jgi:GT2 family glycosyltransferase
MRLSVVINTYNRGPSLRQTLCALRYQTCQRFEAVVVNGPSTDNTAAVLREVAGTIRVANCPEVHLSKSRNLGIGLTSGEVVAFLDDDAIPEPSWAAELLAAYNSCSVGGAGGIVYDHTGFRLQYRYATCDRLGTPNFEAAPPFDAFNKRNADPFVYLQGTNASFRRQCLAQVGGFDEEIEYYLDEVEVCMRVLDLGFKIRPLATAAVHHKYLASHLRSPKKVVLNPYPLVKNRCYFALLNGQQGRSVRQIRRVLTRFADGLRADCETHFAAGRLTDSQRRYFLDQVDRGLRDGIERGLHGGRQWRVIPPPDKTQFLPYPVIRPHEARRTVCILLPGCPHATGETPVPPEESVAGSLARAAAELAAAGHEVHTITSSGDSNRVDFEDGIWAHRLALSERLVPSLDDCPERGLLIQAAVFYREVDRIHGRGPVDVVAAPRATGAGRICALDGRFTTALIEAASAGQSQSASERLGLSLAGARAPTNSRSANSVTAGVASLLVEVAGLQADVAGNTAKALLDPACYPTDYPATLLNLCRRSDDEFVRGLFLLLFGREVDPPSLIRYQRLLQRGMPRRAVLRHLALSREASENGLPLFWLAATEQLLPADHPSKVHVRFLDRVRILATRLAWAVKHTFRWQRRAS